MLPLDEGWKAADNKIAMREQVKVSMPVFDNGAPSLIHARVKCGVAKCASPIWSTLLLPNRVIEAAIRAFRSQLGYPNATKWKSNCVAKQSTARGHRCGYRSTAFQPSSTDIQAGKPSGTRLAGSLEPNPARIVMTDRVFPPWLHMLAVSWILLGAICAVALVIDEVVHPQKMWIMNVVWPLTALFGTFLWVGAYYMWGRNVSRGGQNLNEQPFAAMVMKGTSHCGAGCTLGDIIVEWSAFALPGLAAWFGWHTVFNEKMFAVWIPDFIFAFLIGIIFQYFTIKPMRGLSVSAGVVAAAKADIASITAWQVGMYGLMAIIQFVWFKPAYGGIAEVASPEFWFAMQLSMLAGFATSYPVNWWLISAGVKEKM